jgi:hypothetical protein
MPLRLLEVGASAGLNLRWDRYRYEADDSSWGDADSSVRLYCQIEGEESAEVAVVERRGSDRAPVDPNSEDGRLTLLSYLRPDQVHTEVRLMLWPDGEEKVIARASYHGDHVDLLQAV